MKFSREEHKRRTQERINRINSIPNFLSVVEIKKPEDKKIIEDFLKAPIRPRLDIKEDGVIFAHYPDGRIEVTTVYEKCMRMIKEMKEVEK